MWTGRRVIVAGGTAGFGLVLGRHLTRAGARVLLVGRSGEGVRRGLEVCEQAAADPRAVRGFAADLAKPGEGERVAAEAARILGGIDDVFFCVGRSGRATILATDRTAMQDYLDANLLSAVELTRAVAEEVAAGGGHLVYIGSLAGKVVTPFMGPYAVAKSALAAYADAVRIELAPRGAHVLLVSPGPIRRANGRAVCGRSGSGRAASGSDRSGRHEPAGAARPRAVGGRGARRLPPADERTDRAPQGRLLGRPDRVVPRLGPPPVGVRAGSAAGPGCSRSRASMTPWGKLAVCRGEDARGHF